MEHLISLVSEADDLGRGCTSLVQDPEEYYIPEYRRGDPLRDPLRRLVVVMSNLDVVDEVVVDSTEMFVVNMALVLAYSISVHRCIRES